MLFSSIPLLISSINSLSIWCPLCYLSPSIVQRLSIEFKLGFCAGQFITWIFSLQKNPVTRFPVWRRMLSCRKRHSWFGNARNDRVTCSLTKFKQILAFIVSLICTREPNLSEEIILHTMMLPSPNLAVFFRNLDFNQSSVKHLTYCLPSEPTKLNMLSSLKWTFDQFLSLPQFTWASANESLSDLFLLMVSYVAGEQVFNPNSFRRWDTTKQLTSLSSFTFISLEIPATVVKRSFKMYCFIAWSSRIVALHSLRRI